jgi:dihydroorotase
MGSIDIIASDHAPHRRSEKIRTGLWSIPSGFPGLETTLPLLLTLVNKGQLSLSRLVEVLAYNPARIFQLARKGVIAPGFDADLTVIDMKKRTVIDSSTFYSKAKYSPFDGRTVVGKAVKVFLHGELVMDDGAILTKPGSGHIILGASPSHHNLRI